ncbi:MAG: DUF1127 domain-containing protein [Bosea sp.]|jgi:uncharacterized protein YjiS (DUF1127 family)|nr:DUF1127 domain-containing protein [Bosea sp. (in: a-proteobacteria)]
MLILSSVLSAAPLRGARRLLVGLASLRRALSNRMAVRELAHLDDHALKDIGLTRSDVNGALGVSMLSDPSSVLADIAGSGHGRAMQAPRGQAGDGKAFGPVGAKVARADAKAGAMPARMCC